MNESNHFKSYDYKSFALANNDHVVTGVDYLCSIYKSHELAGDFILWFARLIWPAFKMLDGKVFVVELFDAELYQQHLDVKSTPGKTQFWVNLLEITGVFDKLSFDKAMEVAVIVSESWNSKILKEFGAEHALARYILDEDTGEIFVTIGLSSEENNEPQVDFSLKPH